MSPNRIHRIPVVMAIIGVLAMAAGVGLLIARRDEGQALPWLFIGAVILGTSGIGGGYRCRPHRAD